MSLYKDKIHNINFLRKHTKLEESRIPNIITISNLNLAPKYRRVVKGQNSSDLPFNLKPQSDLNSRRDVLR